MIASSRASRAQMRLECGFSWFRQKPNRIGFSRNLEKGYFSSRTIPYAGIQLAYHLGFNRVFVVGMDLNSSLGRFYEQGCEAVRSRLDGDYEHYILPCFELMAERVINPDFRVFNLSPNSRLPASVVPKLDLDQLDALLCAS
jgi:Kdo-III transferase WaaZ